MFIYCAFMPGHFERNVDMMKWTKHIKDENGASAIIVALMLVVLLSAAALAVDLGAAYAKSAKVQNTCDSAALAAAHKLPDSDTTITTAKDFIKENGIDPEHAVITINDTGTRVEVRIKEDVNTGFAKIIGIDSVNVNKSAIAGKMSTTTTTTKKKIGAIFNYLLFQGSTDDMVFGSGGMGIYGQVHGNGNIKINAELQALGGISQSGNDLYTTNTFPIIKKNETTGNFDKIGTTQIQWWPYQIQAKLNDGTTIDDIRHSEYYVKEEDEIPMPDFITDNLDKLIPAEKPGISNFSGWKEVSSNLNSALDSNVHYTGTSTVLEKSFSHNLYTDGNLKVSARTSDITINGDIYCDGSLNLWAYGAKITINGNLYVKGDLKISTNNDVTINGNIYCNGDISSDGDSIGKINCDYIYCNNFIPGGRADISGVLVAENQITFTASSNSVSSSLAVVSKKGNINLTAGSQEFNGIVYAPEGTITLGGITEIHGNLIAKKLNLTSALSIYPLKDSTIEDLYDTVLKDSVEETITSSSDVVKLIE